MQSSLYKMNKNGDEMYGTGKTISSIVTTEYGDTCNYTYCGGHFVIYEVLNHYIAHLKLKKKKN